MEAYTINTVLCLVCVYAVLSTASASVSLKFYKDTGADVFNSVEQDSTVRVICKYPVDITQVRTIKFFTFASETSGPIIQRNCILFGTDGDGKSLTTPGTATLTTEVTAEECNSDSLSFNMVMNVGIPYIFECTYEPQQDAIIVHSGNQTLRSHVTPTAPRVTVPQDATKEGDELTFTCESEARPPPKLRFRLNSMAVTDSDTSQNVTQNPASSTIRLDSNFDKSVLTWVATANKDMNRQMLYCDVYDHPSAENLFGQKDVAVIFGPEPQPRKIVSWNLKDEKQKTFTCSLPSNPEPSYVWYNGTVTTGTMLPNSGHQLILNSEDYSYVTADSDAVTHSYTCQGTNNRNNGKTGTMMFTIKIMNVDITTTTSTTAFVASKTPSATAKPPGSGGGSGASTGGTDGWTWQWALIAIAVVLVILVLVVGVIFIKRRNSSSPAKIKKAAAKNPTPPGDNSLTYPYSSTGQPDIIRNNPVSPYNSSPAHQPNNRYSQPNVEDYANAIDHAPRSRKPVVLDEMELDPYNAPPASEAGPPAYLDTYNDMENGGYGGMRSPHDSYNLSYGAAC